MRRQDFRGILTCFCGPIQERILPDCILQLILEISGHVKFARQAIRFNIFFPPIHYKACLRNALRRNRVVREDVRPVAGLPPYDENTERTNPEGSRPQ